VSLAADTAKSASNWNLALTLNWFIGVLEKSSERVAPIVALDMIHEHLSSLERGRIQLINEERIARELQTSNTLAEVLT